jgi:hypothetical protein
MTMKKLLFLATIVLTMAGLSIPLAHGGSCSTPSLVTGQPFGGSCSLTCGPGFSGAGVSGDGINVDVSLYCTDPPVFFGCLAPDVSNLQNPIHCHASEAENWGSNAVPCTCLSQLSGSLPGLDGVGVVLGASCNCL